MISPHEQPVVQWGTEPNNNYYNYYNPQCYVLPNPPPNHQQPIQSPDAINQSNSPYAQPVQQPTTSHLHAESALPYYNNYDHQLNHLVPSYMPPTSIAYRPRKFAVKPTWLLLQFRSVFWCSSSPLVRVFQRAAVRWSKLQEFYPSYTMLNQQLCVCVRHYEKKFKIILIYCLFLGQKCRLTAIVNKFGNWRSLVI